MSSFANLVVFRDPSKPKRTAKNARYRASSVVPIAWYALFSSADLVELPGRYWPELTPITEVGRAVDNLARRLPRLAALGSIELLHVASEFHAQLAKLNRQHLVRIATDELHKPWYPSEREVIGAMLDAFDTLDALGLLRIMAGIGTMGDREDGVIELQYYESAGSTKLESDATFINTATGWPTGDGREGLVAANLLPALPEELAIPDLTFPRPLLTYDEQRTYSRGDRLKHPTFGHGVVEELGPRTVLVLFLDHKQRELAHDLGAGRLEKKYETSEAYQPGDLVRHPKLGPGLVTSVDDTHVFLKFSAKGPPTPLLHREQIADVRRYRPTERFSAGEELSHPIFGKGIVQESKETTMIVRFTEGNIHTLAQGGKQAGPR